MRSCKLNKVKKNKHESESDFLIIITTIRIHTFTKSTSHKACSYNIHHTGSHNIVENRFPLDPGSPPPYGRKPTTRTEPTEPLCIRAADIPSSEVLQRRAGETPSITTLHPPVYKRTEARSHITNGTFTGRLTPTSFQITEYDSLDALICFAVFNTLQDTHISSPPSIHE